MAMDGLVIGGWRRTLTPDQVHIRFKLVRKLTPAERLALQRSVRPLRRPPGSRDREALSRAARPKPGVGTPGKSLALLPRALCLLL